LVERLWAWCNDATMAALAEVFRARGVPWIAVANAFSPEYGATLRAATRQPAWARLPAFAQI
jgi:nicotinamidase-related amidase